MTGATYPPPPAMKNPCARQVAGIAACPIHTPHKLTRRGEDSNGASGRSLQAWRTPGRRRHDTLLPLPPSTPTPPSTPLLVLNEADGIRLSYLSLSAQKNLQKQLQQSRQGENKPDMERVAGGDERWVHVLYFLSRDGKVEQQPHLMRVLRCCRRRDAVLRLQDVKRWMTELRGTGMPDSFAWACKRRYKRGYVWEDLADDDAITPVSGGEYVLLGSVVTDNAAAAAAEPTTSSSSSTIFSSSAATAHSTVEVASPALADLKSRRPYERPPVSNPDGDRDDAASPTPPPLFDDGEEVEEEEEVVGEASIQNPIRHAAAAFRMVPDSRAGDAAGATGHEVEEDDPRSSGEEDGSRERASNAGREGGRPPLAFWNLLRCGADAVQTYDSALLPLNPRRRRGEGAGSYCNSRRCHGGGGVQAEPTDESRRGGRSPSRSRAGGASADRRKKTAAATVEAPKPAAWPLCSQCGRSFIPERLHSHMKSCRALKGQRKSMGSRKLQQRAGAERAMPSEETAPLFLEKCFATGANI